MPKEKRKKEKGKAKPPAVTEKSDAKSPKAKRHLTYRLSQQFLEDYTNSSPSIQKDIDSTLILIDEHKGFTPGMKPCKWNKNIWYLRAGGAARITFEYLPQNTIYLRRCGDHSLVDKKGKKDQ